MPRLPPHVLAITRVNAQLVLALRDAKSSPQPTSKRASALSESSQGIAADC